MDFYTGLVTAAVGAAAMLGCQGLSMFGEHDVPGAGLLPEDPGRPADRARAPAGRHLGARYASWAEVGADDGAATAAAETRQLAQDGRPVGVLIVFGVIAPLVAIIGYIPAMILLVLVVLYGIERRRDFRCLLAAVLIPVATYVLFAHLFSIPLPSGPLLPA